MERAKMARETGLEPATSGVTGRRSNQLSYSPAKLLPSERCRIRDHAWQVKDRKRLQTMDADPDPRAVLWGQN